MSKSAAPINIIIPIFEKYGNTQSTPFTIEKQKIEKILSIYSNMIYAPLNFDFSSEIVTYSDVAFYIQQSFSKYKFFYYTQSSVSIHWPAKTSKSNDSILITEKSKFGLLQ